MIKIIKIVECYVPTEGCFLRVITVGAGETSYRRHFNHDLNVWVGPDNTFLKHVMEKHGLDDRNVQQ